MQHGRGLLEARLFALSSFGLVLFAGGCSKAPPASAPAAGQVKVDPCGGLSAADVASILKIAPADVKGPQHFKEFSCVYRAKDDFYKSVKFNVYPEDSAAQAAHKLQSEKQGFAFLSPIKAIDKLGDEAAQKRIAQIVLKHLP